MQSSNDFANSPSKYFLCFFVNLTFSVAFFQVFLVSTKNLNVLYKIAIKSTLNEGN